MIFYFLKIIGTVVYIGTTITWFVPPFRVMIHIAGKYGDQLIYIFTPNLQRLPYSFSIFLYKYYLHNDLLLCVNYCLSSLILYLTSKRFIDTHTVELYLSQLISLSSVSTHLLKLSQNLLNSSNSKTFFNSTRTCTGKGSTLIHQSESWNK